MERLCISIVRNPGLSDEDVSLLQEMAAMADRVAVLQHLGVVAADAIGNALCHV